MEQVKDLTIEEIEALCRLYNECRLSVLEETELEYVLHCTTLSTDLINETKSLMGISRQVTFPKHWCGQRMQPNGKLPAGHWA